MRKRENVKPFLISDRSHIGMRDVKSEKSHVIYSDDMR